MVKATEAICKINPIIAPTKGKKRTLCAFEATDGIDGRWPIGSTVKKDKAEVKLLHQLNTLFPLT